MYSIEKTILPDVYVLSPIIFSDDRGSFCEIYSEKSLKELGIEFKAVQENYIYNEYVGVIRGLHYQKAPFAQAKIVRCVKGKVDDVAVDLRKDSPNYLKWVMVELTADNRKQLYLPRGFAHGVISREAGSVIEYIVDNIYSPADDRSIRYDDPQIGVDWKCDSPVLSQKDNTAPFLKDSDCNF